jgi:hypothetical protein
MFHGIAHLSAGVEPWWEMSGIDATGAPPVRLVDSEHDRVAWAWLSSAEALARCALRGANEPLQRAINH